MKEKVKKYWFMVAGIAIVILDNGFDAINPLLIDLKIPTNIIDFIKIGFGIYAIIRLKQSQPISTGV